MRRINQIEENLSRKDAALESEKSREEEKSLGKLVSGIETPVDMCMFLTVYTIYVSQVSMFSTFHPYTRPFAGKIISKGWTRKIFQNF